ncbi:MAG TPA: hypothetical protein VIX82_05690 [Solirubrobacteraceae bacterium]
MTDCTRPIDLRSRFRRLHRAAVSIAVLALASGWAAGPARADGDPASDVLASQAMFLPQDAAIPANQAAQLGALLTAAGRSGYQIRVAVIASPADLGSVTELWRQPQNYARFLGQELSLVYPGPLLVVMPNGYGLYRPGSPRSAEQSALATARSPGRDLGTGTLAAIQRLAAASGHTLSLPKATAPSNTGSTDTIAWVVFAIGAALIALAWTASLRARPLRAPGRRITST